MGAGHERGERWVDIALTIKKSGVMAWFIAVVLLIVFIGIFALAMFGFALAEEMEDYEYDEEDDEDDK